MCHNSSRCVLTASSSGLGLATTKLLSEQGANVAVLDIQEHPNQSSQIRFWECDVSNDNRVEECVNEAIGWSKEQNKPLGGAVCCAGVGMAGRVARVISYLTLDNLARRHSVLNGSIQTSLRCTTPLKSLFMLDKRQWNLQRLPPRSLASLQIPTRGRRRINRRPHPRLQYLP